MESNQMAHLHENFGRFTNLERLNLDSNHLTTLPDGFGGLVNLRTLYIQVFDSLVYHYNNSSMYRNAEKSKFPPAEKCPERLAG